MRSAIFAVLALASAAVLAAGVLGYRWYNEHTEEIAQISEMLEEEMNEQEQQPGAEAPAVEQPADQLPGAETPAVEQPAGQQRTDPPGCAIAIDGVAAGTTPRLFTYLDAKETYKVKLTKAGYLPQELVVKFNGREPLVRDETMVLDSGAISIISDPAGAEVTVNGIVRGVTPLEVKDVPKGRAAVKFRLEGFAEEGRELAMRPGDRQTLSIVLSPLPGSLRRAPGST